MAAEARFPDGSPPRLESREGGRIGLQKHTGTVRFRNIQIRQDAWSLQEPASPESIVARNLRTPGDFRPLFNSRDLTGWQIEGGDKTTWAVQDGSIVAFGCNSWDYRTGGCHLDNRPRVHTDFVLRLDFNLAPNGSSGIGICSRAGGK